MAARPRASRRRARAARGSGSASGRTRSPPRACRRRPARRSRSGRSAARPRRSARRARPRRGRRACRTRARRGRSVRASHGAIMAPRAVRSWRSNRRARRRAPRHRCRRSGRRRWRKPNLADDGQRGDVVGRDRRPEPGHAVLAVGPVEQRPHDLGRDALAAVRRLDPIADLDPALVVRRRVEPGGADDPARPSASSRTIARPSQGWAAGSTDRSGDPELRGSWSRSIGHVGRDGRADAAAAAVGRSPATRACMNVERHRHELESRGADGWDVGTASRRSQLTT